MKLPVSCRLARTSEIFKQLKCKGPIPTRWKQLILLLNDENDDRTTTLSDMADQFKLLTNEKSAHITNFLENSLGGLTSKNVKCPTNCVGRFLLLVWLWPHKSQ